MHALEKMEEKFRFGRQLNHKKQNIRKITKQETKLIQNNDEDIVFISCSLQILISLSSTYMAQQLRHTLLNLTINMTNFQQLTAVK